MTNERPDLGFGGELDGFDPKAWDSATKKNSVPRPPKEATMQMAEAIGFKSREPKLPVTVNHKIDRRRRTGRNAQFNLKARPETIEAFCRIADRKGWGLGETLEEAVMLLERELSGAK
ncbi:MULTISPECIES: hypothetical protein [Hyphomicrobiales]|jgi:hypothetical protein|uniref:Stability/partitioning determinant n=1 Tax=Bosea massiliensis TaxID=151419 RepID=A0ABW0P2Z2_9HYPH|nr:MULTISPECIES: hypothetical protein [Hyphomicrobiales]PZR81756.1 MAG: stability/partitioning determinant [Stutzerimonas stutzeri]|tara:strand:+ start:2316 stop:2669 length:354 start_codon:yes stop_codon:yes gene_type:complete